MGFVDDWLRGGQTSREYAECIGLDLDVFREWILDYGRPSMLIPVRVTDAFIESPIRANDGGDETYRPRYRRSHCGTEHRLIPVVIQERS